jgi:hypothetical protein
VFAYPTTGYPGYPVPQSKPPTRKGPWLWVLAGLCTVLAAGTGALGYLIATETASSRAAIAEQDAEIEDLESRIRQSESDNQAIQDTTDDYSTSLAAQEDLLADLRECPAAVQAYIDAALAGDEGEFERAVEDMIVICHI